MAGNGLWSRKQDLYRKVHRRCVGRDEAEAMALRAACRVIIKSRLQTETNHHHVRHHARHHACHRASHHPYHYNHAARESCSSTEREPRKRTMRESYRSAERKIRHHTTPEPAAVPSGSYVTALHESHSAKPNTKPLMSQTVVLCGVVAVNKPNARCYTKQVYHLTILT